MELRECDDENYTSAMNYNYQECETKIFVMLRKHSILFDAIYMVTTIVKIVCSWKGRKKARILKTDFLG